MPSRVAEGNDVLFLVHNLPEKFKTVAWFRGPLNMTAIYGLPDNLNRPGPAHSGRETIFHNGSMLLEKVNLKDTGFYTVRTYNIHGNVISTTYTYLNVYGKLFVVNSVRWVRFIPLNTYRRGVCAYLPYALCPHVGVWALSLGLTRCRIKTIDQNPSFDFTLHTGRCVMGSSSKDISSCLDSKGSYHECFLEKDSEGINIEPGWG